CARLHSRGEKMNKDSDKKRRKSPGSGIGRREALKLGVTAGVGAVTGAFLPPPVPAQQKSQIALQQLSPAKKGVVPGGPPYLSSHEPTRRVAKYGWKNTSGRAYGNGPMDDISKQIVSYVHNFHTPVTDSMAKNMALMLFVDTIGCGIAGFETDG